MKCCGWGVNFFNYIDFKLYWLKGKDVVFFSVGGSVVGRKGVCDR